MEDIDYCPRCNMAVIKELDSSKLAHCTSCFYSYCTDCKEAWHQGRMCKTIEDKLEELEQKQSDQNDKARLIAEKLKQHLKEEEQSKKAVKESTTACPGCSVRIQKSSGCNFMTCTKCGINFCWECHAKITDYGHFSHRNCQSFYMTAIHYGYVPPMQPQRGTPEDAVRIRDILSENPERKKDVKLCPVCHQKNLKEQNNNHIKCWCCNNNYCFLCTQKILGKVTLHFQPPNLCRQHTD